MAVRIVGSQGLYQALKDEGFELPKNCGDVELEMPVDGVMTLRYRQMLDDEDLQKVGRALIRLAETPVGRLPARQPDVIK